MTLDDIGFYTLTEARAAQASAASPLWRCELLLTKRCNFACPYCRHVGEELPFGAAQATIEDWCALGIKNLRLSGGEPTLYPGLVDLVWVARLGGVERIALSTNGSARLDFYRRLVVAGVSDFSISLDVCCAEDMDLMTGGQGDDYAGVVEVICELSRDVYVTVGVVLTDANVGKASDIIAFAHSLGVADIRVIPAAQNGAALAGIQVPDAILAAHPILRYRVNRMRAGLPVRGLSPTDSRRCALVMDDVASMGGKHYPCIIYLREGGKPIGTNGPGMRSNRAAWAVTHDTHADPICAKNCLDVCVAYNNRRGAP